MSTATHPLPDPADESRGFARMRWRVGRTLVRHALERHWLRTLVVLGMTMGFWLGMFYLFSEAFDLMNTMIAHEGTRAEVVHAVLNVFFVSLLVMMTVSSGILLYSILYRSRETKFLLTQPIRPRRIVYYKFQETLLIGSWGFLLLGTPLLFAYGRMAQSPWYFYVMLLPFLMLFAAIPIALGAILCLLMVRYLARLRIHALGLVGFVAIILVAAVVWSVARETYDNSNLSAAWFQKTLGRLQYAEQRWLPSWWLSTGLLEAAHPAESDSQTSWMESLGFLAVLGSNAMVLFLALGVVANRCFVGGFTSLAELGSSHRRAGVGWFDRTVSMVTRPFPRPMRLLLVKDLRVFRRDPMQWMQFAVFFGLLTFYFLNVRRLHRHNTQPTWMMAVGYLNVSVVGLLLATFTTRFIYPLVSLEGRRFWVLGTLPLERRDIIWSKFLFAAMISLVPCVTLVLLSDIMLQLGNDSVLVVGLHLLTACSLCLGLCGIAVGLGALLPNMRESAPAKIASGFGGTMTLVTSILFIMATVACSAVPTYWWFLERVQGTVPEGFWSDLGMGSMTSVVIGAVGTALLGVVATCLPLWSGLRAFRKQEL